MSKLKVHNVELSYLHAVAILWLIQLVPILAAVVTWSVEPGGAELLLQSADMLFFIVWSAMANAFVVSAVVWYAKNSYKLPQN